jgi:hypothetical protein
VLLYAVNCCADATAHYVKRGAKKKVYVAAPVVAPAVVVQKKALVPAAKVYTVPVVQLKTPIASGRHLLKRITIRPIRINQGKEYVAPTLGLLRLLNRRPLCHKPSCTVHLWWVTTRRPLCRKPSCTVHL